MAAPARLMLIDKQVSPHGHLANVSDVIAIVVRRRLLLSVCIEAVCAPHRSASGAIRGGVARVLVVRSSTRKRTAQAHTWQTGVVTPPRTCIVLIAATQYLSIY